MSESQDTRETKVVGLYMSSNDLKIRSKLKARIEGNIEKKCSSAI